MEIWCNYKYIGCSYNVIMNNALKSRDTISNVAGYLPLYYRMSPQIDETLPLVKHVDHELVVHISARIQTRYRKAQWPRGRELYL